MATEKTWHRFDGDRGNFLKPKARVQQLSGQLGDWTFKRHSRKMAAAARKTGVFSPPPVKKPDFLQHLLLITCFCHVKKNTSLRIPKKMLGTSRFKVTFSSPSWKSLNPLKGSLNHPKKVTLNHQEEDYSLNYSSKNGLGIRKRGSNIHHSLRPWSSVDPFLVLCPMSSVWRLMILVMT